MAAVFDKYTDLLNAIIARKGYTRYLEIGVQNGHNLKAVECQEKAGVDVWCASPCEHHVLSDEFFRRCRSEQSPGWDLIFIDGDHRWLPALRDIVNALEHLNPDGIIFVDNINPQMFDDQMLSGDGTVWKAWATLRVSRRDLFMVAIDRARGWGIIRRGKQELYAHDEEPGGMPCYFGAQWELDWPFFEEFRAELLNLVSEEEFVSSVFDRLCPPKVSCG